MPVCIVAYLEIIHIQQCDSCRADGLTDNFFVIAAVVNEVLGSKNPALSLVPVPPLRKAWGWTLIIFGGWI